MYGQAYGLAGIAPFVGTDGPNRTDIVLMAAQYGSVDSQLECVASPAACIIPTGPVHLQYLLSGHPGLAQHLHGCSLPALSAVTFPVRKGARNCARAHAVKTTSNLSLHGHGVPLQAAEVACHYELLGVGAQ